MKNKPKQLSLFGTMLGLILVVGASVSALPLQASPHAQAAAGAGRAAAASQAGVHQPAQPAEAKGDGSSHLAADQLKACENRQQAIENIMARISDRGQKQLSLFTTIATRVENFYTSKDKTLTNYDALVADVNAKQAAAQTTVDTIKSDSTGFSCDGSDPKAFVDSFKSSLKTEIAALQAYRTSVKNLIIGVKSVESTNTNTDQNTTGQTPTGQTTPTTSGGAQ